VTFALSYGPHPDQVADAVAPPGPATSTSSTRPRRPGPPSSTPCGPWPRRACDRKR